MLTKSPINDSSIIANLPASEEVKSQVNLNFKIFKPTTTCFALDTLNIKGVGQEVSKNKALDPPHR